MSALSPVRILGTFSACPNLIPDYVEKLERLGIPAHALAGPTPLRRTYVHFNGDRFEFEHHHLCDGSTPAYVFLVFDQWGDALDIVAWNSAARKATTWLGRAWALSEETVLAPRLDENSGLPVWRLPVGWLKARREGIVIVRPEMAALRLEGAGPLIVEDDAHGEAVDQLLTRPKNRILVPSQFRKAS